MLKHKPFRKTHPFFTLFILSLTLFLAGLACNLPASVEVLQDLELPTPAPTPAPPDIPTPPPGQDGIPTAEAPIPPASDLPQTYKAAGVKTGYNSDGNYSCQVPDQVVLTVPGDGTAKLQTTGPMFIDYINCTPGSGDVTYYFEGTVDPSTQTVRFETCNEGRFGASGSVTFKEGLLTGEVTCIRKAGGKEITLSIGG